MKINKTDRIKKHIDKIIIIITMVILLFSLLLVTSSTKNLKGTARVVNFTGIVRGATQRLVKLEISGEKSDELVSDLDAILYGLKNGSDEYKLTKIEFKEFQNNLVELTDAWDILVNEIYLARDIGYENTSLIDFSEDHFFKANATVFSAEKYADKQEKDLRTKENISLILTVLLIAYTVPKVIYNIKADDFNIELMEKAYKDPLTGLHNKAKCIEFLSKNSKISTPTAVLLLDINNLKKINDTWGNIEGDICITNFSKCLNDAVPPKSFVGRNGGDEFIAVLYNVTKEDINNIINNIDNSVKSFNSKGKRIPLSYCYGFDMSINHTECTIDKLYRNADQHLFDNKEKIRKKY